MQEHGSQQSHAWPACTGSPAAHLADGLALGLLEAHEKVIKAGVGLPGWMLLTRWNSHATTFGVVPVVLDPITLQEAMTTQLPPLLRRVEGHVQA